jgi:hypothetical protein
MREMIRRAIKASSYSSSRRADHAKTTEYSATPTSLSQAQDPLLYARQRFSWLSRTPLCQRTIIEVLP